jgi:hypothetical protein
MNYYAYYEESGKVLYKEKSDELRQGEGIVKLTKAAFDKLNVENERLIFDLKKNLRDTDYIACKIAEGAATAEEYAEQIAERQAWRDQINLLEGNDA